ncbi:MAG: vanadium-dependent haloperoxidase [Acidobacteriota bacterium]
MNLRRTPPKERDRSVTTAGATGTAWAAPCVAALAFSTLAACGSPSAPSEQRASGAETIVRWNETLLGIAEEEDGFLTLKGVRAAAMMHSAMLTSLSTGGGEKAAVAAAHAVALHEYPGQASRFAHLLGEELSPEATVGRDIGAKVVASRDDDGWDAESEYRFHPMAPGVYAEFDEHSGTPKGFVFGSGWARARPFVLASPDALRAPPPPETTSTAYAEAFREVKELGAQQSDRRTQDQKHLALWWKDFAERSHNRLARQLALDESLDLQAAARLFAQLNVAIFDAYVSAFDNKFHYNHWRPYTAVRWADHDGNDATIADLEWTNLHDHTYAFPSYPSAHGTACTAAMTVLAGTFGEAFAFTMTTEEVDSAGPLSEKIAMSPPTRQFSSFDEAALECSLSRVYLGIHFRYDSLAGHELGAAVGEAVLAGELRFGARSTYAGP